LNLINYAAKTINDSSLKNMSINTLTLIIKEILDNYKSKKINLFDQQISFKNGLAGLGYNLLNFITLSEL
jgi:lantibiotic modifying enzyme